MDVPGSDGTSYALLPEELLQVVGGRLSSSELRNARLVCTGWAKALAHCMPAVTVALPRQASERIFRQPLVLCSSGVLNSAQHQDYSAVPKGSARCAGQQLLGRRRPCRHSIDGAGSASSGCKRACMAGSASCGGALVTPVVDISGGSHGSSSSSIHAGHVPAAPARTDAAPDAQTAAASKDKPSPFATEWGQAVLDCLLEDPILAAAATVVAAPSPGAAAAGYAACYTGTSSSSIPKLPHAGAIKAAISMPPALAEQAAATQQQQAMQLDASQMRKLASVPANTAHPVASTKRLSRLGPSGAAAAAAAGTADPSQQQQMAEPPHPVVTTMGPVIQGWSSLPSAGLRTCSSLKQLHLKLSGAPPSPADLLDLSKLLHLTHLSFKQVDVPDTDDDLHPPALEEDSAEMMLSSTGTCNSSSRSSSAALTDVHDMPSALFPVASTPHPMMECSAAGSSKAGDAGLKRSNSIGPVRLQHGMRHSNDLAVATDAAATASALEACHISSSSWVAEALQQQVHGTSSKFDGVLGAAGQQGGLPARCSSPAGSDVSMHSADAAAGIIIDDDTTAAAADRDQGCGDVPAHSITCSVITAEHVKALAQLPYLSSLELAPKAGVWDAASKDGLAQLGQLTGLTKLSIAWGDAAAAKAPLSNAEAVAAVQHEQLALQKCLAGLTGLQELSIHGAAVVDVAILQRLQQLRSLTFEGVQVVSSEVLAQITGADSQQQQQGAQAAPALQQQPVLGPANAAAAPAAAAAAPGTQQQQRGVGRWASLPYLQHVHAVHPASDISLLLQSTVTPQLSSLGFVTRGPSDFARLLGQHGRLRTLHLAFAEEESWHPIAVVRLPTALPSLQSLTIDGKFWLPNSLIVALGVMEVPLEHLSLTCKLAPACLQRLQHLKRLKRLALHHVPAAPPGAKGQTEAMLQLPAKLLPPQLQELEISNGWILH